MPHHPFNPIDVFAERHIGLNPTAIEKMLEEIGSESLEHLIHQTVPAAIRLKHDLRLPEAVSEYDLLKELRGVAAQNSVYKSYIGLGYSNCITPGVILRNILENPGWYTQYTPYQAEISQGRMEALINFQTMVADLTGMDIANASLLDEGTAAAEAMTLIHSLTRKDKKGDTFFVSETCHPQTIAILATRAEPIGIELVVGDHRAVDLTDSKFFGAIVQYPATDGVLYDYRAFIETAHANKLLVAVAADILSLTLLTPPGEFGADVVVGSAQRFGVPMGFGGPHAAFFATREAYVRQIPGRIIGVSVDSHNKPAYRLTLQTREQHIRREKATSNICTAQVLLAIMASMYAVYLGPDRLRAIARKTHLLAKTFAVAAKTLGFHLVSDKFFDTVQIQINDNAGIRAQALMKHLDNAKINIRVFEDDEFTYGVSFDETTSLDDVQDLIRIFARVSEQEFNDTHLETLLKNVHFDLPNEFIRQSAFLTHPVFNSYHTETEMLRYIKRLESRDLSLTTSMIPLGSCTMKLNATTEMIPVTWAEFGNMHPFAPKTQTVGYQKIISELEQYLNEITGFAACSLQPNSGAQGEYAGLMVIREYFKAKGQTQRNVALIPSSAHGTNPASAVMAGMKVIVTKCDDNGNIDVADLKAKAEANRDALACLMVTYPSTHGVFEESIREVCQIIHDNGGRVYMDGANMNAQVGLTNPATIGADVCHLNLHKTFCIPHGGGGPGMGPICVVEDLAPYLPSHPLVDLGRADGMKPVSAAPWGSASILLISYIYIRLMGGAGLTNATKSAILNANYIKARLEKHFPVLYQGVNGTVAHELILDLRSFKHTANIEVEDIAKRLIDYGFHAPTVSFPVPGTLMIEPTESEAVEELDRFCDAMIAIRREMAEVESGAADPADNVLKNAPHTAAEVTATNWSHPYTREQAAYPVARLREYKFWAPVGRVNNSYGDRNIMCSCIPIEAYAEAVSA